MKTALFQFLIKHKQKLFLLIPLTVFLFSTSAFFYYVKDDAFITFRFSRNLVSWGEFAFNRGIKVEGFTNFLWVLILAIPALLKIDQLIFAKIVSFLLSAGAILYLWKTTEVFNQNKKDNILVPLSVTTIFASGTSFALWTMSGLENGLFMFLILSGLYHTYTSKKKTGVLLLTLSCLTRPEGHLFLIAGAAILGFEIIKEKKLGKEVLIWFLIPFSILSLYHIFRFYYYGSLFPNTFLVKGSPLLNDVFRINTKNGFALEGTSVRYIKEFLDFNLNKYLLLLSFASLITRKKEQLLKNLFFFFIVTAFFVYHIKIGKDSMIFYRLFLPIMPILAYLSIEGVKNISSLFHIPKKFSGLVSVASALPLCVGMMSFSHSNENKSLNRYMERSAASHQALGHYLVENAKENDVVAFQDMGGTPYIASNLNFFDTIGVVDPWMGRELGKIKYNPFLRREKMGTPAGKNEIAVFSTKFRNYLFDEVNPEWVAFVAYSPKVEGKNMSQALAAVDLSLTQNKNVMFPQRTNPLVIDENSLNKVESFFSPSLAGNSYYHGLYSDARFKKRYQLESYWKRTENYWIVLFKKKSSATN
ncbi:MAG: hypothetical protein ACOX2F_08480 [bacterium]